MKAGMFAAVLLAGATVVQAQEAPNYRVEGALLAGSVPAPFAKCNNNNLGVGARLGVARRLIANLDLQATGTAVAKSVVCAVAIHIPVAREPGVYVDPIYDDDISNDPMFSADMRARVHSNGKVSAEFAAGAGWGFVQNVPYGVIAGGLRFGSGLQIGVGGEMRSYRVPYDLGVTIIPETGPVLSSTQDGGHVWRRAEFFTLSASLPLGRKRTS